MTAIPNNGNMRIAIDWADHGVPMFTQGGSDPLNLVSHAAFFVSMLKYVTSGSYIVLNKGLPPDYPITALDMSPFYGLNKYGAEFLEFETTDTFALDIGKDSFNNEGIAISPSTEYTAWIWYASDTAYTNGGGHSLQLQMQEVDTSHIGTQTTTVNFDTTGTLSIIPVKAHFTTNGSSAWLHFNTVKSDSDSTHLHLFILGIMLLPGNVTSEPTWNAGDGNGWNDEITQYTKSLTSHIGKTQWENSLFDEGTLTITLDNQSKIFSPQNTSGFFTGYFKPYLRVWVLISDSDGLYHLLWSGFTQQYSVVPGIVKDRTATITCRQGLFLIQAQDPDLLNAASGIQSDDAVKLLFAGGYNIPTGTDDSPSTPDYILENFLPGQGIPLFGTDFVGQVNKHYDTELGYVSELNGNYLFLTRYGRIFLSNWDYIKNLTGDVLDFGFFTSSSYTFSPQDFYKNIQVNYSVYTEATSGVEMEGQEFVIPSGASNQPLTINPTYNGKPFIGNVILDVSSFVPTDTSRVATSGTGNATFTEIVQGIYTYYTALANNSEADTFGGIDLRLSLVSRSSDHVWYAVTADKQYVVTGTDRKSLNTVVYNNPLITADGDATTFGDMQAERRTSILGWFDSGVIPNKSADAIDFVLSHTLGSVVNVTEAQTGNITLVMSIIAENFTWTPGYFQMQYYFAPTGKVIPMAVLFDSDNNGLLDSDGNILGDSDGN